MSLAWAFQGVVCLEGASGESGEDTPAESSSSGSDLDQGDIPLAPEEAWWEIRREWAEAVLEAGPAVAIAAAAPRRLPVEWKTAALGHMISPPSLITDLRQLTKQRVRQV